MCWLRIEKATEVVGERLLQYWRIRLISQWNMYDTLSEGEMIIIIHVFVQKIS